jgi:hypothetical protein
MRSSFRNSAAALVLRASRTFSFRRIAFCTLLLAIPGCTSGREAAGVKTDRQEAAAATPADELIQDQAAAMAKEDQRDAATATKRTRPAVTHRDSPLPRMRRPD